MKKFNLVAAQGEIIIRRVNTIPKDCEAVTPKDGTFSIAPSDNGHNHIIDGDGSAVFRLKNPPAGMRILYAIIESATALRHLRSRHTHEALQLDPGIYEFRIGREYNPYAGLVMASEHGEPSERAYGRWLREWSSIEKWFKSAMGRENEWNEARYNEMGAWIWQWPLLEKWFKSTRAPLG